MLTKKLWLSMLIVVLVVTLAPMPAARAATVIRVTPTGTTSGACGGTWGTACDLQYALTDVAVSGDEIWVQAGTYKPTTGNDRNATFQLKNGVALYGGFAGTETERSQRNWINHITTLSGEIGAAGNSDNVYHVVSTDTVDAATVLDGFTVTGGNANDPETEEAWGGGMYNYYGNPTIQNTIFRDNTALEKGGGMLNTHSSPTLFRVSFSSNASAEDGGGMSNMGESAPTLTNVTFSGNSAAGNGGAMLNDQCSPILTNVTFDNNSAIGGNGGALYNDLISIPVLTNVTFYNNTASMDEGYNGGYGGAVYNYVTVTPPSWTNVTFVNNHAVGYDADHSTTGGALYLLSGATAITNTILWGNTPDQIYSDESSTTLHTAIVQGGCPAGLACTTIITADPLLGALGNYGGSVETIPLLPGSPALDTGRDASCPAADARGVVRPQGPHCDIGAFESSRFTLEITGGNNQSTLINTAFAQPLQVSVNPNNPLEPVNGGKVSFLPPASGASAILTTSPATIAGNAAGVNATANGIRGAYMVSATMVGASNTVGFSLRNLSPVIFHVKPSATGTGSCANWANACELQTALGEATSGDEIWVAAGTYKPTTGSDRNATFLLVHGAALYGGFAGTETARNQRNWLVNIVTLSGDIGSTGDPADNVYHVVTANGTDAFTLLDGVTVTGGQASGEVGGGVYINNGSLTIANCRIVDNSADYGGGLYQSGANERVEISNSWIERNTSANHGGGLYVGGSVQLENTQVLSNTATWHGGGLHASSGDATLIGSLFRNNRTLSGNGGGVNVNNNISVNATQFISNTAQGNGGGLLQWNGNYTVTLTGARFEQNMAHQEGGGLWIHGNATARNVVIVDNVANVRGSGVLLTGSLSTFQHVTIARNTGGEGNGVLVSNNGTTYSNVTLTNVILVNQTVGITTTAGNTTTLNGVLWYSNGTNYGGAGSTTVQNVTTGDPAFAADGYHLTRHSAAIDQGINSGVTTDIDGDPRPMGAGYDLGADEYRFIVYLPLVIRG